MVGWSLGRTRSHIEGLCNKHFRVRMFPDCNLLKQHRREKKMRVRWESLFSLLGDSVRSGGRVHGLATQSFCYMDIKISHFQRFLKHSHTRPFCSRKTLEMSSFSGRVWTEKYWIYIRVRVRVSTIHLSGKGQLTMVEPWHQPIITMIIRHYWEPSGNGVFRDREKTISWRLIFRIILILHVARQQLKVTTVKIVWKLLRYTCVYTNCY